MTTAADTCSRHPDRLAVEHCETCQRPVCAACLWYTEAGQRLCPDHAADRLHAGQTVIPPDRYAAGIAPSQASAARLSQPDAPYKGNSTDVTALLAALAGASALLTCGGFSWLIPVVAFILGLAAWLQQRDALEPRRARWLSLLGLAGGSVFILALLAGMAFMLLCFVLQFALVAASRGGPGMPTPGPYPTVFP